MALHNDGIWFGSNPEPLQKGYKLFVPFAATPRVVWDNKSETFSPWGRIQLKAEKNDQRNMVIKLGESLEVVEMKVFTTLAFKAKVVDVSTLPAYTVKVAEEGTSDIFLKRCQEYREVFSIEFAEDIDHLWD